MAKVAIIGDVHGDWIALNIVLKHAIIHNQVDAVIQVGDFGYCWPGQEHWSPHNRRFRTRTVKKFPEDLPMYWVDGNHENFTELTKDNGKQQKGWTYIPRGTTINIPEIGTLLGIGGANSIDTEMRTPGYTWWPEEAPGYGDQLTAVKSIDANPDIVAVISHEHPDRFPYYDNRLDCHIDKIGEPTRVLLDNLFSEIKPDFWFFGHHHQYQAGEVDNCRWYCAPIVSQLSYLLWNGDEVDHVSAIGANYD